MNTPPSIAGHPCVYLWKDLIHVGRYRHPRRRFSVNVDRPRLDHWVKTFKRMLSNGVKIPIPADHSLRAADNRGFIVTMKRVGDSLMALCQFIGHDAAREAARNQVSIAIAPHYIDGKNNHYSDAILHVALTPIPIVPHQSPFLQTFSRRACPPCFPMTIQAAHSAAGPALLQLTAAHPIERTLMATRMLPCDDDTLAALHDLVPGLETAADDQKLPHLLQHLQSTASLSHDPEPPPHDEPLARAALLEAARAKRDLCIERGALTPAIADTLLATFTADALTLSHDDPSLPERLALTLFTTLADNRPAPPPERTTRQLSPLLRPIPGDPRTKTPLLYEKMAAMADGHQVDL